MALLQYGSSGDDVRELQQALTDLGYDTGGVDGIFGGKTDSAVRAYQQANNLASDGIAGTNTFGSLEKTTGQTFKSNGGTGYVAKLVGDTAKDATGDALSDLAGDAALVEAYKRYDLGGANINPNNYNNLSGSSRYEAIMRDYANGMIGQQRPDYDPKWDNIADDLYSQLLGMSYDKWSEGPDYERLRQQYTDNGRMAMQNTLAQTSARTGGLASSYAQFAAQQQYQNYMQQLMDAAYDRYNADYGKLQTNAGLAGSRANDLYNRYYNAAQMQQDNQQSAMSVINQLYNIARDRELAAMVPVDYSGSSSGSSGGSSGSSGRTGSSGSYSGSSSGSSGGSDYSKAESDFKGDSGTASASTSAFASGTTKESNGNTYLYVQGIGWLLPQSVMTAVNAGTIYERRDSNGKLYYVSNEAGYDRDY